MGNYHPDAPALPSVPKDQPSQGPSASLQWDGKPRSIIDISHWESVSDWSKVKASCDGLYTKATQGLGFVDPKLGEFIHGANSVDLPMGVYHVIECGKDVNAQVDHFLSTMAKYKINHRLRDANDFETEVNKAFSSSHNKAACLSFNQALQKKNGYKTLFYCNTGDLREFQFSQDEAATFDSWIANYMSSATYETIGAGAVKHPLMWQHTDKFEVPGIGHADHSHLYGSIESIKI